MPRTRSLAGLCASILVATTLAAACGGGGAGTPTASASTAECVAPPVPSGMAGWGQPACTPTLFPLLATNNIARGAARILFLYIDASNNVASAPDRTAQVSFFDLASDPDKPVITANGEFVWTIQDERGMYILHVDLPSAGTWGAEFTTEAPGSPAETVRMTFEVQETSPTIAVGDEAPAFDTPTLADVGGDVTQISTDADPVPAFYETSVADALADHRPFVLVFATPKFCTSAQCGPTLDRLKPVAAEHPEVTFINVEPYKLQVVDGQLQPLLDANGALQASELTDEWGLLTEPWIFAVDRAGIVRGSYELIVSDAELDAALVEIAAEG